MKTIIKRDGREVEFQKEKISDAIRAAMKETSGGIDEFLIERITNRIDKRFSSGSVEDIQNVVELELMKSKRKDVAKAYVNYRYLHGLAREKYQDVINLVLEKAMAAETQNQNANVDEKSFGGRTGEANDVMMRQLAMDYLLSPTAKENHISNMIYTHDLNSYLVGSHNCLSVPLDDLLAKGFNTRQTDVRPAQSINTAMQLVAVLFQIQSLQQFGGVSATHLDWTMVPYVRKSFYKHWSDGIWYVENLPEILEDQVYKDCFAKEKIPDISVNDNLYKKYNKAYQYAQEMTEREAVQAVEGLFHNLNTLQSRSGNQLPFSSINFGTCTLPEGRMIIKAVLDASIKGIGKLHKTSIFPCSIFQIGEGINKHPGDPNYDMFRLALQSTAKRLYPNYANIDWSGNAGYDKNNPKTYFSTMGCRTANGWDINGFGQLKDGRGNIAPVTIILPTLAMMAKEESESTNEPIYDVFMRILDTKIHEAKDQLIDRFEWICSQGYESAKFMYENNTMAGYDGKDIRSALKHGTLAIGMLGMAETLQILRGCDHTTPEGMDWAKHICKLYKERCAEFKEQYKLNFGVYFTPAENLVYTAMQKFKNKYGVIPNVSDKEFFTNSIHVPVWKTIDPFEKIDIESQLTGYSSAGCITYVELESSVKNNIDALEALVVYAMDKDVPYFAINVPNDTCMECGYCDELNDSCPECGGKTIQRLRRVTGYLSGDYKSSFNKGKQQEVEMRTKHSKAEEV